MTSATSWCWFRPKGKGRWFAAARQRSGVLQAPARPVGWVDVLVGFRAIGELHVLGVPFELRAGQLDGDHSEHRDLRERTTIGEVRVGFFTLANRVQPILVVLLDSRNGFGRALVGIHFGLRNNADAAGAV